MLKHFLYLNERALEDYLSAMEDGARKAVEARRRDSGATTGKAGIGGLGLSGERETEREETVSRTDTPPARFERLLALLAEDPERAGWVEVMDVDAELSTVGRGALIDVECEVSIPQMIQALSGSGGLIEAIDAIQGFARASAAFGSPTGELPDAEQMEAVKGMSGLLGEDKVVVGEPSDSNWRVAGKLKREWLRDDIEDYARVVGKVSSRLGLNEQRPLLALPGMNLMNRDQRREMERKGPSDADDGTWLKGPAVMLEILAIYR